MKNRRTSSRFLSLILVFVMIFTSVTAPSAYGADGIGDETEIYSAPIDPPDEGYAEDYPEPSDETVQDDSGETGKDNELLRLEEEARNDAVSDEEAISRRLVEEAARWNIPISVNGVNDNTVIRSRLLDPADESDSSLVVQLQNAAGTYGLLDVYEIELTDDSVLASGGSTAAMQGIDVFDVDRVALLRFDTHGNFAELPYHYNPQNSEITFILGSSQAHSSTLLATAIRPVEQTAEESSENALSVETELHEQASQTAETQTVQETGTGKETEPAPDTESLTELSPGHNDANGKSKKNVAISEKPETEVSLQEQKNDAGRDIGAIETESTISTLPEPALPADMPSDETEPESEYMTETETEAMPVLRLRSTPRSLPWQDDYTYVTGTADFPDMGPDIPYIELQAYNGSSTDVVVPGSALIDGVSCLTKISPGLFKGNETVTSVRFENGIYCDDCTELFSGCTNLSDVDLDIDFSAVTSMNQMFRNCKALHSIDMSGWNCPSAEDYSQMFEYSGIRHVSLGSLNFRNARTASNMFHGCTDLASVDLAGADTSNVPDMSGLFYNCQKLSEIDLSLLSTSSAVNIENMFSGSAIQSADITSWNVENVQNARFAFSSCSELKNADLEGLVFKKDVDMHGMFCYCSQLEALNMSDVLFSSEADLSQLCNSCYRLKSLDLSTVNLSNVKAHGYSKMLYCCNALEYLDISTVDMGTQSGLLDDISLFGYSSFPDLNTIVIGDHYWADGVDYSLIPFPGERWRNMDTGEIYRTTGMETADISALHAGTYLRDDICFILYRSGDAVLQAGPVPDPEMGDVSVIIPNSGIESKTSSGYSNTTPPWYSYRSSIKRFIIKDPLSVLTLERWFCGMTSLKSIEGLEKIDTTNTTSFASLFEYTYHLDEADLHTFHAENVRTISSMFSNSGVKEIKGFGTLNFEYLKTHANHNYSIFQGTRKLQSLDLTSLSGVNCTPSLSSSESLLKIIIPEGFHFHEQITGGALYDQEWFRLDTDVSLTSQELFALYGGDSAAPAATYSRSTEIRFDGNAGTASLGKINHALGMPIGELPDAIRKGYLFDGWFTQRSGGTELHPGSSVDQLIYYAHWVPITYTLRLDANGAGQDGIETTLSYTDSYTLPGGFSKDGYVLTGWNTRSNGRGASYVTGDSVQMLTAEPGRTITLYAEWAAAGYLITFDSHGGSAIPDINIQPGSSVGTLYTPFRDGYTFLGWFTQEDGGERVLERTIPPDSMTCHAHWMKDPIITYVSTGDTVVCRKTIPYGQPLGVLPSASNGTLTLLGWFTEPEGGSAISSDTAADSDRTYYAHWGYMLQFNPSGGTITEKAGSDGTLIPDDEASDYEVSSVATAVKDGCVFDGWYTSAAGGDKIEAGGHVNMKETSMLYAHWTPASDIVILTCNLNGGMFPPDAPQAIKYYAGQTLAPLYEPTRNNYVFAGWYDAPEGGNPVDNDTVIMEDMAIYAQWSPRHKLIFNTNGGTSTRYGYYTDCYVEHGKTLKVLPGTSRSGYQFEGWFTELDGGEALTTSTPVLSDATYYAHWIPAKTDVSENSLAYSYSASWANSSNSNVDSYGNAIIFHPGSRTKQTAMLNVFFELNQASDTVLPVGAVRITVPKNVFKSWYGSWIGTNNLSTNLPEYPSTRSGMLFSYINESDSFTLINNQELSGGAGVNVTISYTVNPDMVPGGAQDSNGNYIDGYDFYQNTVPVVFNIDTDLDGNAESAKEKELSIEMHTAVRSTHSKGSSSAVFSWNYSWGTKPADDSKSFYVKWMLNHSYSRSSSSQDLDSYEWSEDTPHDGTVIYQNKDYVITKHPLSDLENAGEDGLVLYNEAILTETWRSGYQEKFRHAASIKVQQQEYPSGDLDKARPSYENKEISSGQDILIEDGDTISMPYSIEYYGGAGKTPDWDEETGTYSATKHFIEITDGSPGDVMYSSGIADNKYAWEPDTGNTFLGDNDYHFSYVNFDLMEYDAVKSGNAWTSPSYHENENDYAPLEIWIRKKGNEDYYLFCYMKDSDPSLRLPDDTVGFKVRHASEFFSTRIRISTSLILKPTARVISLIQDDASIGTSSIIKNAATCRILDEDGLEYSSFTNRGTGNSSASDELYELTPDRIELRIEKEAASSDHVVLDAIQATQDNTVTISASNYNYGRFKRLTSGQFYDLLPIGTMVDETTIHGSWSGLDAKQNMISGTLPPSSYDVSFASDWEHSGRTMMIIKAAVPESLRSNRLTFRYSLRNTFENVVENGTTVINDLAFVNTSPKRVPYYKITGGRSSIKCPELFDPIENMFNGYIGYASANVNYIPVDAYSWGYSSMVKTASHYKPMDETLPNNEYTYRLTYSQSEYTTSDRIVFFNVLEAGTQTNPSEWQGQFKSVNVKSIMDTLTSGSSTVTCNPVIYYATKDKESFTAADFDVANADTWTTVLPADPSTVTAVAIDCTAATDGTPFVLSGKQSLSAYITMTAPGDADMIGKSTANPTVCYARKASGQSLEGDATPEYSDTTVTIRDTDLELHKSSDPESGTEQSPARVENESDLAYTLSVTNNDSSLAVHDIVIEDTIPECLDVEWDQAVVFSEGQADAIPVEISPRIILTHDGRNMAATISQLWQGETLYIRIPSVVNMDGRNEAIDIINTASIVSASGLKKEIRSETTYHRTRKLYNTYYFRKQWNELEPDGDILLGIDGTTGLGLDGEVSLKSNQTFTVHAGGGTADDTDLTLTADEDGVVHVPGVYGSSDGGGYTVFSFSAVKGGKRYDFRYELLEESPAKPARISITPSVNGRDSSGQDVNEVILDSTEDYKAELSFPGATATFTENPVSGWTLKEPDGITVTPDGDDFLVEITNEARKTRSISSSAEEVALMEDLEISKEWKGGKSAIAFDIHDSEGKTSKVTSIVIRDGENMIETLDGANGAIISQKSYNVEKAYTADITFEDGTEKTVTINTAPFERPDITIRITSNGETQDVVLRKSDGWKKTVPVFLSGYSIEELTTGDWESSVDGPVVTNIINREIPITTVNTTTHRIIPQTGNKARFPMIQFAVIVLSAGGLFILLLLRIRQKNRKKRKTL